MHDDNPSADGWRERAERIVGPLEPYASPVLGASEIGEFGFCPQAWFLSRCDIPLDAEARFRLQHGSRAHRRIGRRTDLLRTAETLRSCLLVLMIGLAAIALGLAIRGGA